MSVAPVQSLATATKNGRGNKRVALTNQEQRIQVPAPKFQIAVFRIRGTAPLVQNRFPEKARQMIEDKQKSGSTTKKGKQKAAKDFDLCYRESQHLAEQGWNGIPASAFRAAMIRACTLVDFKMTTAKLCLFVLEDGRDKSGVGLVKITKGKPRMVITPVRNASGVCDLRPRAHFDTWEATVRVRFDADQFTIQDVTNLMMRAGVQVGIGEARPSAPNSVGMDMGTFEIVNGN